VTSRAAESDGSGRNLAVIPDATTLQDLLAAAHKAASVAYAPYSHFHVGAAVLCVDGEVVTGCNVENASYGLSMCAERNALFAAVVGGRRPGRDFVAVAVSCPDAPADAPVSDRLPCGACRQVLHEMLGPDGIVIVDGGQQHRVAELIPGAFTFNGGE
jgi:cytidine deaminase